MTLLDKGITKALISLRGCAGWSAPVLFVNPRGQVFSRRGPFRAMQDFSLDIVAQWLARGPGSIPGSAFLTIFFFFFRLVMQNYLSTSYK